MTQPWNLLSINFKYEYFHNSVDLSGLCLRLYMLFWLQIKLRCKVFTSLGIAFVKLLHFWPLIWSLIPMKNILPMNMPAKNLSPICHKKLFEQGPSILCWERHYALAPLENHVGVCALLIFSRKFGLKLFKRLNLAKRNAWQEVSGLRHYVRLWMLSVKTSLSTPLRLKLFVKLFFTFKFK